MTPQFLGPVRRFGATGLDQALSSVSNVLVAIALGRAGGASELGEFALVFAIYLVVLGFSRSLIGEPLLALAGSSASSDDRSAVGGSMAIGVLVGCPLILMAVVVRRYELAILAAALPTLCGQDAQRYAAFRARRAVLAVKLDSAWVAVSIVGVAVVMTAPSAEVATAVWAGGSVTGFLVGCVARLPPSLPNVAFRWWRGRAKPFAVGLTVEGIAYSIGSQTGLFIIIAAAGDEVAGQIRASQVLLGPASMALAAVNLYATPRFAQAGDAVRGYVSKLTRASAASGVVLIVAVGLGGEYIASAVFSSDTITSRELLVAATAQVVLATSTAGVAIALKATGRVRQLAVARTLTTLVSVPVVAIAAAWGSVPIIAWSLCVAPLVNLGLLGRAWSAVGRRSDLVTPRVLASIPDTQPGTP